MRWKDKLTNDLLCSFENNANEDMYEVAALLKDEAISLHLAIFSEPFLSLIFLGEKTMESRFSINNVIPYGKIVKNDIVLMKKSGGPVVGYFIAGDTYYYSNLSPEKINLIEKKYGKQLAWDVDPDFLTIKATAQYLTLVKLQKVIIINPIETTKADRTGWALVKLGLQNTLFKNGND